MAGTSGRISPRILVSAYKFLPQATRHAQIWIMRVQLIHGVITVQVYIEGTMTLIRRDRRGFRVIVGS